MFNQDVTLVKRYGYRQARPKKFLFSIPRIWVKDLEEELCKQAGKFMDNHVTFVFQVKNPHEIISYNPMDFHCLVSVFFTDLTAIFGIGIDETEF